jgi:hypothetical protein
MLPASVVLTEDDYLDFLISISNDDDLLPSESARPSPDRLGRFLRLFAILGQEERATGFHR